MAKRKQKEKQSRGRPTKLTKKLQEDICGYIENGASFKDACLLANIDITTFCNWRKQGKIDEGNNKDSIYSNFSKATKKAEATFKIYHVQQITKASREQGHWQASAWLLERKYPDEYGKYDRLKITGDMNILEYDIPVPEEEMKEAQRQLRLFLGMEK